MKANLLWKDQLKEKDGKPIGVYDLAFHPNGDQLILAAGNAIQVFDTIDGNMINKLNAHKDNVHSVSYTRDGTFFASGSADKHVIIWTSELEGHLKYSHNDGIQCIAYNPVSYQLLSCAISDIGLWSPEHRIVAKRKVSSRVCSCSWTNDGQYFALGLFNGLVSIWTKNGDEKIKIERPGGHPVFALAWNPSRNDHYDMLSVCDWGQRLSFYQLSGRQIGKDRSLGFDPCFYSYSSDDNYVLIGGSNRRVCLYSKEGLKLGGIGEEHSSWVWSCRCHPKGDYVVLCCNDGVVECYQISPTTVHGLYKDRYVYREGLTDVTVQHLITEEKVRLRCRDLVKKIAVYKNRLAVQLPEKVVIYELNTNEENGDLTYTVKDKFSYDIQCSLLVVCSENIVLCLDKKLQCFSMKGEIEREWEVDAQIRYIKVIGGPSGREVLLAGLKNGQILRIFLDNPFTLEVMRIQGIIRCLDLNISRTRLAIVDEANILTVYDMKKRQVIYQEPNATSVAWNTQYEDMLCYSGGGLLYIKASTFPSQQQRLQSGQGFVVGFTGSKIFSLHFFNMTTIDVPQSAPMIQYLERKMFKNAYQIACLGVTQNDWRTLALEALEGMNFEIAKKAFIRVRDFMYLELIHNIEERRKQGETNTELFLADICAYQGKFHEAARLYQKSGHGEKAIQMYTDLCQFELAKQMMGENLKVQENTSEVKQLITKQAEWAKTRNEPKTACDTYLLAGEYIKAINIMSENAWTQQLVELCNKLDTTEKELLKLCGQKLKQLGEFNYAADVYHKSEDYESLAALYAETQQWQKGFDLVQSKQDYKDIVYLPYATHLIENDNFEEAQAALSKAEKESEAINLLNQLTENALRLNKYKDAGYYHWLQARANMSEAKRTSHSDEDMLKFIEEFHSHIENAEMYYVYHEIHRFINQPFTNLLPEALFNMSRFLVLQMMNRTPKYISKSATLLTLAKQSTNVEAYITARYAYDRLQSLIVPSRLQEFVDIGALTIRGKPLQDKEEILPFCYRCSTTNPLINTSGNWCVTCGEPFVYSFISFEVLPVVQFHLDDDISDEEAIKLISSDNPHQQQNEKNGDIEVLQFHDEVEDSFTSCLVSTNESGMYSRVIVDRNMLSKMHWSEVVIKKWEPPLRYEYYRSLLPNVQIRLCSSCNQMFYAEDYELHVLCKGQCPFCRQAPTPN